MRAFGVMLAMIAMVAAATSVAASGLFVTNEAMQIAPVQLQALIYHTGHQETLFLSQTFTHNPLVVWNFAWVLAVPAKPQIELVKDDLFTKTDFLTRKTLVKDQLWQKLLFWDLAEEKNIPSSIYSRPVDLGQYHVYAPDTGLDELRAWLVEQGFILPKRAEPMLQQYQQRSWYLIAVIVDALHIQMQATDSLTVYGAHTWPLKLTFDSNEVVLPLRLGAITPDLDSVAIPLSSYEQTSEQVLGVKDDALDKLLVRPSLHLYPQLPLDLANLKVDVAIMAPSKYTAEGFTTIYADWVGGKELHFADIKDRPYFEPQEKKLWLTRLIAYRPLVQLEDVSFNASADKVRVNPILSPAEIGARLVGIVSVAGVGLWLIRRR